jgi:hypothetical protein
LPTRCCTFKETAMKWITRESPKIGRIACPWLIAGFIDRQAEFLYVLTKKALRVTDETNCSQ